jgi:tetratricopeptide (TPR) repeat protein
VQALAREQSQVTPHLAALVRKQLIRPERPQLAGEDGFRFRHLLIRDAAYEALPKATRADLHVRLAAWLERSARDLVELDEILGYHLEQAWRYRVEVGLAEDDALAAAARRRLTNGGQRAARRQDYTAAASLFERASALVPLAEVDLALESELGEVLFWTGRAADALRRADSLAERASAAGNRVGELCGRIKAALIRHDLEPEGRVDEIAVLVEQALPELEGAGDDLALYIGYCALGDVAHAQGRVDATLEAYEQALAHARRSGYEPSILGTLAWCRFTGSTPVSELLGWLDENEPHAGPDQFFRAYRAWSFARLGRFDEARAIVTEARTQQAERGGGALLANLTAFESVWIELLAGDPAAAAAFGEEGCRLHEELGEQPFLAAAAGSLAQALYALDRLQEADAWAGRAADLAREAWAHMLWRQVRGKVLARRGEHAEAQRLAREAVAIADDTDQLDRQGDAYADLAEVLRLGGKPDEAAAALEQALGRYERKGNLVSAERARTRLAELQDAAPH